MHAFIYDTDRQIAKWLDKSIYVWVCHRVLISPLPHGPAPPPGIGRPSSRRNPSGIGSPPSRSSPPIRGSPPRRGAPSNREGPLASRPSLHQRAKCVRRCEGRSLRCEERSFHGAGCILCRSPRCEERIRRCEERGHRCEHLMKWSLLLRRFCSLSL